MIVAAFLGDIHLCFTCVPIVFLLVPRLNCDCGGISGDILLCFTCVPIVFLLVPRLNCDCGSISG